jgi:hypothetical protein
MGFGNRSGEEKARDTQLGGASSDLFNIGDNAQSHSNKAFKFFKKSAKPAMDYWNTLLSGDRNAMEDFLGPEISKISKGADVQKQKLSEFMPRGGGQVSAINNINDSQSQATNSLIFSARPQAAQQLGNLSGMFSSASQGFGNQAIAGKAAGSDILFNLNKEAEAAQQRRDQAWGGIGAGVGNVAGAGLGALKCCFIFMEALNGPLPDYVRELRDYYYSKEPKIALGYIRMSKVLVPLMQKSRIIKYIINSIMVKPIISYGAFLKNIENGNKYNIIYKKLWFSIWRIIGIL